jgi:hypothetical protein
VFELSGDQSVTAATVRIAGRPVKATHARRGRELRLTLSGEQRMSEGNIAEVEIKL